MSIEEQRKRSRREYLKKREEKILLQTEAEYKEKVQYVEELTTDEKKKLKAQKTILTKVLQSGTSSAQSRDERENWEKKQLVAAGLIDFSRSQLQTEDNLLMIS